MKKIVIIGGGFAGTYIAKKLETVLDVALIDSKDYFEFTPGVLRAIVEPEHANKIEIKHKDYLKKSRIIIGCADSITHDEVIVNNGKIKFDYLVIATGSRYSPPFKEKDIFFDYRGKMLAKNYERLCKAKSILIIGGGIVGVELAGEIVGKYKDKKVVIVHNKSRLMERQPKKASKYAEEFLRKNKVEIIFNENVIVSKEKKFFKTDKGRRIDADLTFICTGLTYNNETLEKCFKDNVNEKKQIIVNDNLQMKGSKNIFVAGDVTSIDEEKTAQNAENHARIVVKNIGMLESGKKLVAYKSKSRVMIISLGKYNGILTYKNFTLTGLLPGFLKGFVEWKTMIRYRH